MNRNFVYLITALLTIIFAIFYNFYFTYDYVIVNIDKGTLRGFKTTSWRGKEFFTFKGIPYAVPPIGNLRFKAPREENSWVGIRDAISHGSVCPQQILILGFFRGNEDCLFLNVYTPKLGDEKLPVMVWIHGGGFLIGSGNDEEYGPNYLIDSDVVLVTINYRLGALGFLSTEDDEAPGNAGMKDQVAALKWVRRNIAKFGGDPDNVTIFGESAGGASVHFHLLSPMSTGLFAKAIAQSGSSLNPWPLSEDPVQHMIILAEFLQSKNLAGDKAKALEILKAASYEDITMAQKRDLLTDSDERTMNMFVFAPSVEKNVKSEEIFLHDYPLNILESGNFHRVPFITGYTDKEGYLFHIDILKPRDEFGAFNDTERYVPTTIKNENLRNDLAKSISKFYFKDSQIGNENISSLMDLYSDVNFVAGIKRATELQLRSSKTPIYFYVFSYDGKLNHFKKLFSINLPGAAHGDELGYLFYFKLFFWKRPDLQSEEEFVLETMTRLWTNFAKTGNPTPPGDPLVWKPRTLLEFNYLNISGRDTKPGINPDPERTKFWAEAYEKDAKLRENFR